MNSTERPTPHGPESASPGPHPHNPEEILRSEKIQIERKTFLFQLRENPRGRFLRITEDVAGRRDTIIIPAPGLEEFSQMVAEMTRSAAQGSPSSP
jgi:hypothetical protein